MYASMQLTKSCQSYLVPFAQIDERDWVWGLAVHKRSNNNHPKSLFLNSGYPEKQNE